jgi:hypothetical protein
VRWGRHESNLLTEVVISLLAVTTSAARGTGLESDAVTRFERGDVFADIDDLSGTLVTEDEWVFDDDISDTAVLVVVNVRAADAHLSHGDEDVVRTRRWSGTVSELELVRFD